MHSNNNIKNNLAEQSYWDSSYSNYQLNDEISEEDAIQKWIKEYIPPVTERSCFEIGCFPGRYLTLFGRLGYELNGIDTTPRVVDEFPTWLKDKGYKTGQFLREDFLKFTSSKKFDLVCSFGFIEHFKNWEEVFMKHLSLVKKGGYLVIETPNFRGPFQRLIHYILDKENYKRHYIPAMRPSKWAKLCKQNGFKVIHSGFIGEFQFWIDKDPTTPFKKRLLDKLIQYYPRLKKMPAGNPLYAPYCGIIAQLN